MPRRTSVLFTHAALVVGAFSIAMLTGGASHRDGVVVPVDADEPADEESSTPLPPPEPEPWAFDPEPLLAGPAVAVVSNKTLVSTELRNTMRRLDRTPEEAALDALNLSMAERAGAEEVLARHQSWLDEWMRLDLEPLERFLEVRNAAASAQGMRLGAAAFEQMMVVPESSVAAEVPSRRSLREALADAVPESDRAEFLRLIHHYESAAVADEVAQARDRKQTLSPERALVRIRNAAIANDLRRSFERQVAGRGVESAEVLEAIDPWHEQDANVRKPLEQLRDRAAVPNGRDWYDTAAKVLPSLSREQRTTLARMLFGVSPVDIARP
jgi:hypothetical protein